jgi:hypothetical protein
LKIKGQQMTGSTSKYIPLMIEKHNKYA